jgi:hypothetical protein
MHARCDADPLDFATDLCDECGGEYCEDHLVYPFGPKRAPLCKQCAIARAGVRQTAALRRRMTRSQMKRRRLELRSMQRERKTLGFEYFDARDPAGEASTAGDVLVEAPPAAAAADPVDVVTSTVSASSRKPAGWLSPLRLRRGDPGSSQPPPPEEALGDTIPGPAGPPPPTPARTSATVLLTRLRESGAVPPTLPGPPTAAPPPVGFLPPPAGAPTPPARFEPPPRPPLPPLDWLAPTGTAFPTPRPATEPPRRSFRFSSFASTAPAPDPSDLPPPPTPTRLEQGGRDEVLANRTPPPPPPPPPPPGRDPVEAGSWRRTPPLSRPGHDTDPGGEADERTPSATTDGDPWAGVPPALRGPDAPR